MCKCNPVLSVRTMTSIASEQDVQHELFQNSNFFDPEDLVQVKYEMLRQVGIDRQSISASAEAFGFSRPSFYQAQSAFQQGGLAGLLPEKRGPRSGHKLTAEVMEFIRRIQAADASLSPAQLAQAVQEQFGLSVHPRSIDRQLRRQKQNGSDRVYSRIRERRTGGRLRRAAPRVSRLGSWPGARLGYGAATGSWHAGLDGGMRAFRQHGRPYRTTAGPATNAPRQLADRDRCVAGRDGA